MPQASPLLRSSLGRVRVRDAWAYGRSVPRLTGLRRPKLSFTALARVSAMDVRNLPPSRRFRVSDGVSLAYRTYRGPEDRHLVLIHGSACFGDQLHALAMHVSRQGLATVHTLDMRGHGQSPASGCDAARFALDVGEFVGRLRDGLSDGAILVGGHSAGGGLAVNVARGPHGSLVDGWLLLAPYLRVDSNVVRPYFGGWLAKVYRARLAAIMLCNLFGVTRFNDRVVARFDREACVHDPRFAREWSFASAFGFGPGAIPDRANRQIDRSKPVLLVSGTRDECFVADKYPSALSAIAPHGEIHVLPGLGHWDILVDKDALDLCSHWLASHFGQAVSPTAADEVPAARSA